MRPALPLAHPGVRLAGFLLAGVLLAGVLLAAGPSMGQVGAPASGVGGGVGGVEARRLTVLFISPCGEPFRGAADEPYPVAAWFAQADANHDGRLDRREFIGDATRFFGVLDDNKDGRIEGDEVAYYEHMMVPEILGAQYGAAEGRFIQVQMGGDMGTMGGAPPEATPDDSVGQHETLPSSVSRQEGAGPYGLLGEPEPVTASDLSFRSVISLEDFQRRAGQRFDQLDAGGKGYLELASLPKTQLQEQMGRRRRRW